MKKIKVFCLVVVFAVSTLLLSVMDARAVSEEARRHLARAQGERVLSVSDIVDVLVSFSNWELTGGPCLLEPLAFIKRKDNDSVEYSNNFFIGGFGPSKALAATYKIEGPVFNMRQVIFCKNPGQNDCWFECETIIEVVSKTHVRIRQIITCVECSPVRSGARNGTYFSEFRKN